MHVGRLLLLAALFSWSAMLSATDVLMEGIDTERTGWVKDENLRQVDNFLGTCRAIDFSQFKPRGHYTESERLGRYFQSMMWCGRIDLAVAGGPFARCPELETYANPREMGMAIVLWHLLGFEKPILDRKIEILPHDEWHFRDRASGVKRGREWSAAPRA